MPVDVVWMGHASVDVRLGPARFVTDPVLRDRLAHLRRHRGTSTLAAGAPDAALISHLHHDHLDVPSLRRLPPSTVLVVPRGAGALVGRAGHDVVEVGVDDVVEIAGTRITAVPAEHRGNRFLTRRTAPPLGFILERDGQVVYFAGDTDLHPVMHELPRPDVALLPIAGWGPTLGPGHLDADRAAEAAAILEAKTVLPIHWGTFAPRTGRRREPDWFDKPADRYQAAMAREAPSTRLHLVRPGDTVHRLVD